MARSDVRGYHDASICFAIIRETREVGIPTVQPQPDTVLTLALKEVPGKDVFSFQCQGSNPHARIESKSRLCYVLGTDVLISIILLGFSNFAA
jgi:hypothetical protein